MLTVVYWGWSPSNSLCVDDAGRTLLTQSWSNTETFIVNQVRIRITELCVSLERCVKPGFPKISDLLRVRSSLSRICLFLVTLKMLHVPITKHKARTWCVPNFEPILGQTYWGVC